jgi:hypothetical protein
MQRLLLSLKIEHFIVLFFLYIVNSGQNVRGKNQKRGDMKHVLLLLLFFSASVTNSMFKRSTSKEMKDQIRHICREQFPSKILQEIDYVSTSRRGCREYIFRVEDKWYHYLDIRICSDNTKKIYRELLREDDKLRQNGIDLKIISPFMLFSQHDCIIARFYYHADTDF